jgi:hypothetical protein
LYRLLLLSLIPLLVFLTAIPTWAAISFTAVTNSGTADANVATETTSVNVTTCTQCVLVACVVNESNTGVKPTGVTFNTTENFVEVDTANRSNGTENVATIYVLVNPTVTTANAVVTFSNSNQTDRGVASSFLLYQGVDQSTPSEAHNTATGSASPLGVSVTTVSANAWVVDCANGEDSGGLTISGSANQRVHRVAGGVQIGQGVSDIAVVSPGAQAMAWTQAAGDWAHVALALKAYVAPASGVGVSGCGAAMLLLGKGAGC